MDKVKQYPWYDRVTIKHAFAVVMVGVCAVIAAASMIIILLVSAQKDSIRRQYDSYFTEIPLEQDVVVVLEHRTKEIPGLNGVIYNQPVLVMAVLIIIMVLVTAAAGGKIYYNWKIKYPMEILTVAAGRMAENDLNFVVEHKTQDEFGELCASFERMRQSLKYINRELWYAVEESKRLNAAFAHDLRTPLTVLQGYGEMVESSIKSKQVSEEQIQSAAAAMNRQIRRLEKYVTGMSDIHRLEEIGISKKEYSLMEIVEELKSYAQMLIKGPGLVFEIPAGDRVIRIDMKIAAEVFGNLLSNAGRYAMEEICISISCKDDELAVVIADDGPGFPEEGLEKAVLPYYRAVKEQNDHLGLGLYICNILCEKHGGKLVVSNRKTGGAEMIAVFRIK